ncbi:MAG: TRAP transporter small permease [Actinomycetota bacterium]|nr:TRAP transporter small permease [Actinomycetota bacterium]
MSAVKYVLSFRWANALSEAAGYISAVCLVLATLVMLHGVGSRYFFGRATVWQTETSIYLLLVVTFFGAAYGLKHHAHVGVDLLVDKLPDRGKLVARITTSLLSLGLILVVLYYGTHLWWEAYEGGFRSPTALRAPLSLVYAILPIGMLLVALQYIAFIIEAVLALIGRSPTEHALAAMEQRDPLSEVPEQLDEHADAHHRPEVEAKP